MPSMRLKFLMMACWRHSIHVSDTQACHIISQASPNPSQRHVIRWRQLLYSSICDPTQKLRTDPDHVAVDWPLTLTQDLLTLTFVLTFGQKLKFLKMPILLSFSRRFRFWILFLHLKLQNWSIGIFLIVVSSRHLQEIFSYLSNLKPSSSFLLEFKGGC